MSRRFEPFGVLGRNLCCTAQLLRGMALMLVVFVFIRYAYQLSAVSTWFDSFWNSTLSPVNSYLSVVQLGLVK